MDGSTAEIGHNNPPSPIDELKARVNEFGAAAKAWGQSGVNSAKDSDDIDEFTKGARALYKEIDEMRVAEKKPHDDAAKAVQEKYKPLLDLMSDMGKAAKALRTSYLSKVEAEERERQRVEREKAAKAEADALAKMEAARANDDLVAQKEAEAEAEKAAETIEAAEKAPKATAGSGMRTVRTAEITNPTMAVAHYKAHPEVLSLVERLANADIRAAKGAAITIPGVTIKEERKVA